MTTPLLEYAFAASLFAAGLIHLIPVRGVISAQHLRALYGIESSDPAVILLLRHRALLFGLLGAFLLASAFVPAWRVTAAVVALFSMLSFVALAAGQVVPPTIQRVSRIDVMLSALIGMMLALRLLRA